MAVALAWILAILFVLAATLFLGVPGFIAAMVLIVAILALGAMRGGTVGALAVVGVLIWQFGFMSLVWTGVASLVVLLLFAMWGAGQPSPPPNPTRGGKAGATPSFKAWQEEEKKRREGR